MRGAFRSVWIELLSEKYVPPHLRRVYPSAFTLFVAMFGIVIYPGSSIAGTAPGLGLDAIGLLAMVLLFLGWLLNKKQLTEHGFWLSAGFWSIAAAFTAMSIGDLEFLEFTIMVCLAFVNLSIGSWVLMRKDPR